MCWILRDERSGKNKNFRIQQQQLRPLKESKPKAITQNTRENSRYPCSPAFRFVSFAHRTGLLQTTVILRREHLQGIHTRNQKVRNLITNGGWRSMASSGGQYRKNQDRRSRRKKKQRKKQGEREKRRIRGRNRRRRKQWR